MTICIPRFYHRRNEAIAHYVVAMLKRTVCEYCHYVLQTGFRSTHSFKVLQSRAWHLHGVDLDAVFIYHQFPFARTGPFPEHMRGEKANYQDQASNKGNSQ